MTHVGVHSASDREVHNSRRAQGARVAPHPHDAPYGFQSKSDEPIGGFCPDKRLLEHADGIDVRLYPHC